MRKKNQQKKYCISTGFHCTSIEEWTRYWEAIEFIKNNQNDKITPGL
jgi:hypothetical protein